MLAFYPLQHISYLRTHELIHTDPPLPSPSGKPRPATIKRPAASLWSSRLWAANVVLQLTHLREDRALLVKRQRALNRLGPKEKLQPAEHAELARRWDAWYNELAVNLSFLPMTIHWYPSSLFVSIYSILIQYGSGRLRKVFSKTM
jgi:hypothetical protein